jgi:Spx/MgsR family transcriptional regulator
VNPTLYGLAHCDQVKRARAWFAARGIDVAFVDYRKMPPDAALLRRWLGRIDAAALVNRSGTTWRKLDQAERARAADAAGATALMLAHPSLIRRPVVEHGDALLVGFEAECYRRAFDA